MVHIEEHIYALWRLWPNRENDYSATAMIRLIEQAAAAAVMWTQFLFQIYLEEARAAVNAVESTNDLPVVDLFQVQEQVLRGSATDCGCWWKTDNW